MTLDGDVSWISELREELRNFSRDLSPDNDLENNLSIVRIEDILQTASAQKSEVAEALRSLLLLGVWPGEELCSLVDEERDVSMAGLIARRKSRRREIESLPMAFAALPLRGDEAIFFYDRVVEPACHWEGIKSFRIDKEDKHEDLLGKLHKAMKASDLFIANLSKNNPNVFYEVAYLEAHGKKGVFLSVKPGKTSFYLGTRNIIPLRSGVEALAKARWELRRALRRLLGGLHEGSSR